MARLLPEDRSASPLRQHNTFVCRANEETGATGLEPATSGVTVERLRLPMVAVASREWLRARSSGASFRHSQSMVATAAFHGRSTDAALQATGFDIKPVFAGVLSSAAAAQAWPSAR